MQIEIEPLKKVTLDGIDIYLSMERAAVASRLGGGDAAGASLGSDRHRHCRILSAVGCASDEVNQSMRAFFDRQSK